MGRADTFECRDRRETVWESETAMSAWELADVVWVVWVGHVSVPRRGLRARDRSSQLLRIDPTRRCLLHALVVWRAGYSPQ